MPGESVPTTPPSGWRGRLRDSWWIAWTFTLFLDWVAFLWIAYRTGNRRWAFWGCVYALPFVALMALPEEGTATDVAATALVVLGVASIVHAFRIRGAYVAQRHAVLGLPPPGVAPASVAPAGTTRTTVGSTARSIGIVVMYVVVGSSVGGVVLLAALFSDPCLPFCVSDESERTQIVNGIAMVGGLAYLALLVPMIRFWNTGRVWSIVVLGGLGIGALGLVGIWLAVRYTGAPAFCNC